MWKKVVLMIMTLACSGMTTAAQELSIANGWVRLVPPVSETTAAYFDLINKGERDRVLVRVNSNAAKHTEMHVVTGAHGVTAMKPVEKFDVHSGKTLSFEPGGRHIMLIGLNSPLQDGETITLQLEFADGEKLDVSLTVRRDAGGADHSHHHHEH